MAQRWPADQGAMGCRRRVLAARLSTPNWQAAESLLAELQARGLQALARRARLIAAQAALAAGALPPAIEHAQQAVAEFGPVDPWTEEPAALWLDAAAVLHAAGAPPQAEAVLARGRAWLAAAAESLPGAAERGAWLQGHPLHRVLASSRSG